MSNLNLQKLCEWVWPWPWTFNFGYLTKVLSLHYLVKCKLMNMLLASGVNVCFSRSTQPSTLSGTVKWAVTHLHALQKVGTLVQLTGVA